MNQDFSEMAPGKALSDQIETSGGQAAQEDASSKEIAANYERSERAALAILCDRLISEPPVPFEEIAKFLDVPVFFC